MTFAEMGCGASLELKYIGSSKLDHQKMGYTNDMDEMHAPMIIEFENGETNLDGGNIVKLKKSVDNFKPIVQILGSESSLLMETENQRLELEIRENDSGEKFGGIAESFICIRWYSVGERKIQSGLQWNLDSIGASVELGENDHDSKKWKLTIKKQRDTNKYGEMEIGSTLDYGGCETMELHEGESEGRSEEEMCHGISIPIHLDSAGFHIMINQELNQYTNITNHHFLETCSALDYEIDP
ncbi:hypothetical protein LXL04_024565 [Taraxacum kok-saghyz]